MSLDLVIRPTPVDRSVEIVQSSRDGWINEKSIYFSSGTSLKTSPYYDPVQKLDDDLFKIKEIRLNLEYFFELYNANLDQEKEEGYEEISFTIFQKVKKFINSLLINLLENSLDIPNIRFSSYDKSIDITIKGEFYKYLITIYENVYVFAFKDINKNHASMQNTESLPLINSIIDYYKSRQKQEIKVLSNNLDGNQYYSISITNGWNKMDQ